MTRVLAPDGSLFLNVGAKPTDPWMALDVAQVARRHLQLQNTIHWVKSIAIDRDAAGAGARLDRDLAVGHYKPINSDRFVNDCHEFIFHFSPGGRNPAGPAAVGVAYQDPSNVERWASRRPATALPGQHLVHALRHDSKPRSRPAAPGVVPGERARALPAPARARAREAWCSIRSWGWAATAVACARLGLDFVGMELDRGYLDEAIARVEEALDSLPI